MLRGAEKCKPMIRCSVFLHRLTNLLMVSYFLALLFNLSTPRRRVSTSAPKRPPGILSKNFCQRCKKILSFKHKIYAQSQNNVTSKIKQAQCCAILHYNVTLP